jgi:FHS family L-fucose permease-like MFS transporter
MEQQKPLVPRKYLLTFILITSPFALWGFANDITNPMVAAMRQWADAPGKVFRILVNFA